jgi:hypothetical protein
VDGILRTFERASDADYSEGINWYPTALAFARSLDRDERKAAGVIAVLSPRQQWDTNKDGAAKIIKAAQRFSRVVPSVAGTYVNVEKAWRIANGENPEIVVQGSRPNRWLKVQRFYQNILGDTECITVDVWAARVAVPNAPEVIAGGLYRRIEEMYQKASVVLGSITPRDLQAVCWVTKRNEAA